MARETATDNSAPALLLAAGSLLACTILLSQLAADAGAAMLWYQSVVMTAAGFVLLIAVSNRASIGASWRKVLAYGIGAGFLQALAMGMAFMSVAQVGADYVALVFAFPLLLTYSLALLLGMERPCATRLFGVAAALAGGLIFAISKSDSLGATSTALGWTAIASAISFVISVSNIYRTRYWPTGASPLPLAGLTLLCAGILTVPFALWRDGLAVAGAPSQGSKLALHMVASVAAAPGAPAAVLLSGETMPASFGLSIVLIVVGAPSLLHMQISLARRPRMPHPGER